MRIGHSYDIHKLVDNRELFLGGIKLEHSKGLLGHSDADVLLHAITESLIGAMAKGDIGTLFPDTDSKYKDMKSEYFLYEVKKILNKENYIIENIDATVFLEYPKLNPHIGIICENIAKILEIEIEQINVKATRGEKLGFIGREEGIAAESVCLILKKGKI